MQTGSGKTYTMTGEPGERFDSERGILPRTLEYIFDIIRKVSFQFRQVKSKLRL